MSAYPSKADIEWSARHVRFVPKADICSAAKSCLFGHRFGLRKQRRWYRETDRLGLSGEVASISSENTQPFLSQKIPMPSEPLATYNRRSTYLIQVRENHAPLATLRRGLLALLQFLAA